MTDFLIECLEKGKKIEQEGIKFYTDSADSVKNQKAKGTLRFLAKEEGRHLEYINDVIGSISNGEDISQLTQKKIQGIFPKKEDFKKIATASKDDKKILEEAMNVEDRSIEFYTECLGRAKSSEKEIFENLIKEEEKHKAWLDYMKDGMEVHGHWYGLDESFAFDGF